MKRRLLGMSMVAAMLLAASSAFAAGVNLSWTNCFGASISRAAVPVNSTVASGARATHSSLPATQGQRSVDAC